MKVEDFIQIIEKSCNVGTKQFFTGVPDSQLKALCDYLISTEGISQNHIITANEGNAVALAAGYFLSTKQIPIVYLQNSGEGNIVNPVASLTNDNVYGIPMIFIIGYRGEPNTKDEPQHIYQGKITLKLLDDLDIEHFILGKETKEQEIEDFLHAKKDNLKNGKSIAFVIRKGALEFDGKVSYQNKNTIIRENAIENIVDIAQEDCVVSTTGKISRELFEIRVKKKQSHQYDFLTVGSMGHSSSIALGIAISKPQTKVWCIDGDGAVLMHMGAMAVIGANSPQNFVHIVLNNEAHESVGGMPTVMSQINLRKIAEGCGYKKTFVVDNMNELKECLKIAKGSKELTFIEVKCSINSRSDLGRPTTTAKENKENFMRYLEGKE